MITVLGMLIGLLDQGLFFALRVTAMQARASGSSSDMSAVDAALRRLIANAGPGVFPEPASLRGTGSSLDMITEVTGADGVRHQVETLLFERNGAMRLRIGTRRHVEPFGPTAGAEETVLLDGVVRLAIDYADAKTGAWRSSWAADILPALVRIRLDFANDAKRWPPIIIAPRLEAPGQ